MKDNFEIILGSGNVFRDFKRSTADADQLKAILAAQIIKVLDARKLTGRATRATTGFAAVDFSRIRNAALDRFTIDRLIAILDRLDHPTKAAARA